MIVPNIYKEVIYYVLIPIFIVILVFGIAIIVVAQKDRIKEDIERRFRLNYWSSVVGIIFGALLLTVSLGFSVAFIEKIHAYHLTQSYPWVLVLLYVFPIVPFCFLIYCIVKLIKVLNNKERITNEE